MNNTGMVLSARVDALFTESIQSIEAARSNLTHIVADAASRIAAALQGNAKILICGNGGSASDSLHFSSELLNKFERVRRPLAAISLVADVSTLTSISNDECYDEVFSKQLAALANPGDILVVITTSGNSPSILRAVETAQRIGVCCIALNGKGGGKLSPMMSGQDIDIVVPGNSTARVQEVHGIIIHAFCELIDHQLFGEK